MNAINGTPAAAALVQASIPLGNSAAVISAATPATLETAGADEIIVPGYVGLGETDSEVILRFAETLPDDVYRLEVFGKDYANLGIHALRNNQGVALVPQRSGDDRDVIDFELNLVPQVVSVVPQPVTRKIQVRLTRLPADGDFRLIFQGEYTSPLNVYTVTPKKIQDALEALPSIEPGEVQVSGANLGPWEISFLGRYVNLPLSSLRSDEADVDIRYLSKLGQATDQVLVYFNADTLLDSSAEDPQYYRLIDTAGTAADADDVILLPHHVAYYAQDNLAVLTFDDDANLSTPYRLPTATYRLEIGASDEADDTPASAIAVGTLFAGTGYEHVSTLSSGDTDYYRVELPAASDLNVTVTPDAEQTSRGRLGRDECCCSTARGSPGGLVVRSSTSLVFGRPTAGTTFTLSFGSGTLPPTTTRGDCLQCDRVGDLGGVGFARRNRGGGNYGFGRSVERLADRDRVHRMWRGAASRSCWSRTGPTAGWGSRRANSCPCRERPPGRTSSTSPALRAAGSYLLQIGAATAPLTVNDANSSFAAATDLGFLGVAGQTVSSQIEPQNILLPQYPGSDDEPGHRQIQAEQHISFPRPGRL